MTASPALVGQYVKGMLKCVLHKTCVRKNAGEDVAAAAKRASKRMVEVCDEYVCVCVYI